MKSNKKLERIKSDTDEGTLWSDTALKVCGRAGGQRSKGCTKAEGDEQTERRRKLQKWAAEDPQASLRGYRMQSKGMQSPMPILF
ncbi:hypothetical protein GOP47_0006443 [Adiantum capillus-veneris]|uniref:Uncharacterized protein n=1 Tax=Adiantum capillus-veneris TaxID=13818 RepID=A0A9D4ZM18_ADICA|nr:hypothetical protein GOP47_0006443 [Adiantum capillus-veneris]